MASLESLAVGLYWACVDFMIHSANLLGLTYRDTNAVMFFILWPAVTIVLLLVILRQSKTLRRLRGKLDLRTSQSEKVSDEFGLHR